MAIPFYLDQSEFEQMFEKLKESGGAFDRVVTSQKSYLAIGRLRYYLSADPEKEKPLPLHSLGLLAQVKKDVLYNYKNGVGPFPNNLKSDWFQTIRKPYTWQRSGEDVEFFGHALYMPTVVDEAPAVAVDLTAAYVTTARNMGLISEEIYKKFFALEWDKKNIIKIKKALKAGERWAKRHIGHSGEIYRHSKDARLIALGALATNKEIEHWEGGEIVAVSKKYCEESANVFHTVAAETGRKMAEIMERHGGYFTYVDCVFVPKEKAAACIADFKEMGYSCNTKTGYIWQNGTSFEFVNSRTGEITNYLIPRGKSYRLKSAFPVNWLSEFLAEMGLELDRAEALECSESQRKIKASIAKELAKELGLTAKNIDDSPLDIVYISAQLEKIGLTFAELYKLSVTIQEDFRVWGESLMQAAYTKVIRVLRDGLEKTELPNILDNWVDPETGLDGEIRRDFKFSLDTIGDE